MRGETRKTNDLAGRIAISIHSPHARGDPSLLRYPARSCHFNPLPSCEGRRVSHEWIGKHAHFNPLPSCEGRHPDTFMRKNDDHFNPLPSCEGRPSRCRRCCRSQEISIHSPHARGDRFDLPDVCTSSNFNPLPSCEGRLWKVVVNVGIKIFQSTPLMRGETEFLLTKCRKRLKFQSTPLMRGETALNLS